MAETKIEWCRNSDGTPGYTFNPWRGCTKVSEACKFCYAERDRSVKLHGVGWGPTAERRIASESTWLRPLAWDAKHRRAGTRGRVFCASLADIFEDRPELEAPRMRLLALIALTPYLDWLLLTKRPDVMARVLTAPETYQRVLDAANRYWRRPYPRRDLTRIGITNPAGGWHNLWAGTTVENQQRADERIPHLLRVPSAVRFLSCEPLLGPVDLTTVKDGSWFDREGADYYDSLRGSAWWSNGDHGLGGGPTLSWVIAGGESGPCARPSHPDWFRSLRDQCSEAGVPFHFKQWGAWGEPDSIEATGLAERGWHEPYAEDGGRPAHSWPDADVRETARRLGRPLDESPIGMDTHVYRVGKKAAGRLLDGRTWDDMPPISCRAQPTVEAP